MIEPQVERLSLVRQCALLGIARSSFYYPPVGESQANLRLMRLMDELQLNCPWYGSRQMVRIGFGAPDNHTKCRISFGPLPALRQIF